MRTFDRLVVNELNRPAIREHLADPQHPRQLEQESAMGSLSRSHAEYCLRIQFLYRANVRSDFEMRDLELGIRGFIRVLRFRSRILAPNYWNREGRPHVVIIFAIHMLMLS